MISKSGKTLALALLTMFGIGRIKYAPGTVASLVTCLIFYLCYRDVVLWTKIIWFLDVGSNKLGGIFLFFILLFICSFILIDKLSVHFKKKDPQEIVIDEFFGQSIPLLSLGIYAMYNNIVLDWTNRYIEHFIFLSSSMAYGNFQTEEIDEEHPLDPVGIYGALKVAGEKIVIAYQQVFDLDYTIIRPSALYGPRCVSRRVGQIFIENAIQANLLAAMTTNEKSLNQIYNVAINEQTSLNELYKILSEEIAEAITKKPIYRDFREGDIRHSRADISKAEKLLGYTPTDFVEDGLKKTIKWYIEQESK